MTSPIYVAIPVYNGARTIARTLHNMLEQTYDDFTILVYDDGSTDETGEIVRDIARTDRRILVVHGEKNRGRGAARNQLLHAARGGIIAWQDADDTWRPTKLEEQLAFYRELPALGLDQDRCVVLSTFQKIVIKDGQETITTHVPPVDYDVPFILGESYGRCPFQLQATFGPASIYLDAGGFDARLNWAEDLDIVLKIVTSGGKVAAHQAEMGLSNYHHSLTAVNGDVVYAAQKVIAERYRNVAARWGIDIDDLYRRRRLNYLFDIYLTNGHFSKAIYTTLSSVMGGDEQELRAVSRNFVAVFRAMIEAHDDGKPLPR